MSTSTRELHLTLFPKQHQALKFDTQFAAAVAGVQSGKTHLGTAWSLKKIVEQRGKNGIIVAPTYKILQAATLKKLFDLAPELRQFYKEQKGEIVLPDNTTVYIRSADNPLGIEGITAHWAWLDEGGMCSSLTWTVLRSRVSLTGGQILITTTPYNMGWLYTDFYKPWKEKRDPQLSFFTWASVRNPYFNKEFFEAERSRLSPEEFARRYQGEFRKMAGLIWDLPESQVIEKLNAKIKTDARIMGVDWGFRNPAAISAWYLRDNAWYCVEEWKQAERTNPEIIQVIQNLVREHHVTHVYPDPAEPDRIEECRRAGVPVYEANKDVLGGISHVQTLIREKRLFICASCPQLIEEMSMYRWVEMPEDKQPKEEPEKVNDHLCDASRYALFSHQATPTQYGGASGPLKPIYGDSEVPY